MSKKKETERETVWWEGEKVYIDELPPRVGKTESFLPSEQECKRPVGEFVDEDHGKLVPFK